MNTVVARDAAAEAGRNLDLPLPRTRIRAREALYMDILDFLYDEAACLDDERLEEWLTLLASDISYFMPVRATRMRKDGAGFSSEYGHFDESYASLRFRVAKLATPSSWGEDPPSRVRRLVTNVRVHSTDRDDEFHVMSGLLLARNRGTATKTDLITAERRDILRRSDETNFKIAARRILVDQSIIATGNLAIFL
jgi:3-phenylpropionate/cinnamic acid dioxygenase small subunit